MRWLGIGEKPTTPAVPPEAEDLFYEAERRNREAVIQSRLSNRRLRLPLTPEQSAINDLLRRIHEKEGGRNASG